MKILAISVHPDDETLGCGGTLLKHISQGDELHWLIATQAHFPQWPNEVIAQKAHEVQVVASAYSFSSVHKLGFPSAALDTLPQFSIISSIREVVEIIRPEIIYMIHDGDVHTDHHSFFVATLSVIKTFYMRSLGIWRILSYETLSSTDAAPPQLHRAFLPNVYQDITSFVDTKIAIMNLYETEAQSDPFPRGPSAIRSLARFRGASIGVEYAEAFMLIREVN